MTPTNFTKTCMDDIFIRVLDETIINIRLNIEFDLRNFERLTTVL